MTFDAAAFYAELDEYFGRYDNEATERFLLESLEKARGDMRAETAVLNELACFYRNTSKWQGSLSAFSELCAVMESAGMEKTEDYALAVLNKAGMYRLMGGYDEALSTFSQAKSVLDSVGAAAYSYASLYNNTGLVYQDMRRFDKAAEYFELGLEKLPKTPENEAERATSLANLAAAYLNCGDREKALIKLDEALTVFSVLDGGNNAHYAGALNTRAVILFMCGDYAGAAEMFEKAIEKTKLIFGENKDFVSGCRNCAAAYMKLGNSERAKYYLDLSEKAAAKLTK